MVTWDRVPEEAVHGILRGYRVFYRKSTNLEQKYRNETTEAGAQKLEIKGLDKYTEYELQVVAFTRKGDGVESKRFVVSTDEDGKRKMSLYK